MFVQPAVCQHGRAFFLGKKSFFVYSVPFYMRINVVRRRSQDELSYPNSLDDKHEYILSFHHFIVKCQLFKCLKILCNYMRIVIRNTVLVVFNLYFLIISQKTLVESIYPAIYGAQ